MVAIALSVICAGTLVIATVLTLASVALQAGTEFVRVLLQPLS